MIEIREGDIVRFGRIPFKVAQFVWDPETQNQEEAPSVNIGKVNEKDSNIF
jgi:hypothetical protein